MSLGTFFDGGSRVPGVIWGNPIHPQSTKKFLENAGASAATTTYNGLFSVRDWILTLRALAGEKVSKSLLSMGKEKLDFVLSY